LKRRGKQRLSASKGGFIQFKLLAPLGCPGHHPGRQQGQHPTDIFRRNKMERAAHGPGADDLSLADGLLDDLLGRRLHSQPNRPKRGQVILGLERTQPFDNIARLLTGSRNDGLVI
jgi:hypothetical protein